MSNRYQSLWLISTLIILFIFNGVALSEDLAKSISPNNLEMLEMEGIDVELNSDNIFLLRFLIELIPCQLLKFC